MYTAWQLELTSRPTLCVLLLLINCHGEYWLIWKTVITIDRLAARAGHARRGVPWPSSAGQSGLPRRRQPTSVAGHLDQERAPAEPRFSAARLRWPTRLARVQSGGRRRWRSLCVCCVLESWRWSQFYDSPGLRQGCVISRTLSESASCFCAPIFCFMSFYVSSFFLSVLKIQQILFYFPTAYYFMYFIGHATWIK